MAEKPIPSAEYRDIIAQMCAEFKPKIVVEVGAYNCDLTRKMLKVTPSIEKLYVVDPWTWPNKFSQDHMDGIAEQVAQWAKTEPRVRIYRLPSHEGSFLFENESIDFWHLDGKHKYETVLDDLACWVPKMRPGGMMSGDNHEFWGVSQAVEATFGEEGYMLTGCNDKACRVWHVSMQDWSKATLVEPHGR